MHSKELRHESCTGPLGLRRIKLTTIRNFVVTNCGALKNIILGWYWLLLDHAVTREYVWWVASCLDSIGHYSCAENTQQINQWIQSEGLCGHIPTRVVCLTNLWPQKYLLSDVCLESSYCDQDDPDCWFKIRDSALKSNCSDEQDIWHIQLLRSEFDWIQGEGSA